MARKLIVNADDFGRSPGVSRGILEAHHKGIVTSTTCMINQPGIEDQLPNAMSCPALGVGLHLVFSAWRPVLSPDAVPGLVDKRGLFLDQHTLWAHAEAIPVRELRAELDAQVEKFVRLAGRLPDHLDCHHFVHLYPPFFEIYVDLAAQHELPLRVPFPRAFEFDMAVKTLSFLEGFPSDLVRGMIATNSALLRARLLAHPGHFVAAFFGREAMTLAVLEHLLASLPDGVSELMCHPGYVDDSLSTSSYRSEREMELELLTHPATLRAVESHGIGLVTFSDLGE